MIRSMTAFASGERNTADGGVLGCELRAVNHRFLELGLRLYEVGTGLSRRCGNVLDAAEARMLQLIGNIESAREEPFDPEKDGRPS